VLNPVFSYNGLVRGYNWLWGTLLGVFCRRRRDSVRDRILHDRHTYHLRYHYRCHHPYHHNLMLCAIGLYVYCTKRCGNDCFTIYYYYYPQVTALYSCSTPWLTYSRPVRFNRVFFCHNPHSSRLSARPWPRHPSRYFLLVAVAAVAPGDLPLINRTERRDLVDFSWQQKSDRLAGSWSSPSATFCTFQTLCPSVDFVFRT